jgi:hypothetical protein
MPIRSITRIDRTFPAAVMSWLREHLLAQERHPERILEAALQRFRALKIEPPTAGRLERMLRSTLQTFEEDFGKQLFV